MLGAAGLSGWSGVWIITRSSALFQIPTSYFLKLIYVFLSKIIQLHALHYLHILSSHHKEERDGGCLVGCKLQ